MPASTSIAGNSIYHSVWGAVLPGPRRLSEEMSESVRAAEKLSQRIINHGDPIRPSSQYTTQSVDSYTGVFKEFAQAGVMTFLGGRLGARDARLIVGLFASIVALATFHLIGCLKTDRTEAKKEEMRVSEERRVFLPSCRQYKRRGRDMVLIKKILAIEEDIFRKVMRRAEYSLVVRIGLFVASVFGMAGAYTGVYAALMVSGGIGAVFSVAWLVSDGFNFAVNEQRRCAEQLQKHIDELHKCVIF